jgi:hypothetical protein
MNKGYENPAWIDELTPKLPTFPPLILSKLAYILSMDNNPDLPDGWAMPGELAKKISEVLNRKSITPEDELKDVLEDMARDIALIEAIRDNQFEIIDISQILP